MELNVTTLEGKAAGSVQLSDEIFGLEPRADIIQRVVNWQLAKRQAGTHKAKGRAEIARHDGQLAQLAYEKLSTLPGIRLLGPKSGRGGLVSFAFNEVHAHDIVTFADEDGIALRGGHHCNQPLMRKLGLTGTTRASFYVYNTEAEIDALVASLRRILKFFSGN